MSLGLNSWRGQRAEKVFIENVVWHSPWVVDRGLGGRDQRSEGGLLALKYDLTSGVHRSNVLVRLHFIADRRRRHLVLIGLLHLLVNRILLKLLHWRRTCLLLHLWVAQLSL